MLHTLPDYKTAHSSSLFSNNTMKPVKYELFIEHTVSVEFRVFHMQPERMISVLLLLSAPLPHRSPSSHWMTSQSCHFSVFTNRALCYTQAISHCHFLQHALWKTHGTLWMWPPTRKTHKATFCPQAANMFSQEQIKLDRDSHWVSCDRPKPSPPFPNL